MNLTKKFRNERNFVGTDAKPSNPQMVLVKKNLAIARLCGR